VSAGRGEGAEQPLQPDGLKEDAWHRLVEVISAASRGDVDGHAQALMSWRYEVSLADQQHAGVYLLYLLFRTVSTIVGTPPTPTDLHVMAMSNYRKFHKFVRAEQVQLEDTYRRAFELPILRPPQTPAEFAVFGSVALGILLTDPVGDLDYMRPGLASWLNRNREKFRSEGLSEA
jgi:hypothetical protein